MCFYIEFIKPPVRNSVRLFNDQGGNMNIKQPKLLPVLETTKYETILQNEDQIFDGVEIIDEHFRSVELKRFVTFSSVIKDSNLSENKFDGADVVDTRFINCDFSNTSFSKASIHRVEFINCKMTGIIFDETIIKDVCFKESLLNLSSINESKLENIVFEESKLLTTDFFNSKLKNTHLKKCDLTESKFMDTSLAGIDISSSFFESLSIKKEDLEGCIVSPLQAIQMASLMGLVVKEDI